MIKNSLIGINEQILAVGGLSPHHQIELRKQGNLDSVTVNCERVDASVDTKQAAAALSKGIKNMVGFSTAINIKEPGEVARSEGKAQRVVDLRNSK